MGLPRNPTLANFRDIFVGSSGSMAEVTGAMLSISPTIITPLINTLLVAAGAVALTMVVSSIAAYNLARFQYRGKRIVSSYILFAYVFPPFILMVPITIIMNRLGHDSLFWFNSGSFSLYCSFCHLYVTRLLYGYSSGVRRGSYGRWLFRFQSFLRNFYH